MAEVSPKEYPPRDEETHDRTQRALQVVVVSGFITNSRSVQASCLGLCNAYRDGIALEGMHVGKNFPPTLLSMLLPNAREARQAEASPTRVLQPQRIRKVIWNFKAIMFGDVDLGEVRWPEGTKEIELLNFDRALDNATWPAGLDRLSFCSLGCSGVNLGVFTHSLQGIIFPSGLREIFLGTAFDQPIDNVSWPRGLERLSLPGFNHPIDDVAWPPALKSLEFMAPSEILLRKNPDTCAEELDFYIIGYNRPFSTLPASLETLWLSDTFSEHSLEGIIWPPGLVTIGLGTNLDSIMLDSISWPSSLRHIYSVHEIYDPPAGCVVTIVKDYDTESQSYEMEMEMEDEWVHGGFLSYSPREKDVYEDDDCPFTGFANDSYDELSD